MVSLGQAYHGVSDDDQARFYLEEAFRMTRKELRPEHPSTLYGMLALAALYRDRGQMDLVLPLVEHEARLNVIKYGKSHPRTFDAQNRLAAALWSIKDYELAVSLARCW
jgi:hypothetical protein